jgi:hypothetical protein
MRVEGTLSEVLLGQKSHSLMLLYVKMRDVKLFEKFL